MKSNCIYISFKHNTEYFQTCAVCGACDKYKVWQKMLLWNLAKLHLKLTDQRVFAKTFLRYEVLHISMFCSFHPPLDPPTQKRLSGMIWFLVYDEWSIKSFWWTTSRICWFEVVRLLLSCKAATKNRANNFQCYLLFIHNYRVVHLSRHFLRLSHQPRYLYHDELSR